MTTLRYFSVLVLMFTFSVFGAEPKENRIRTLTYNLGLLTVFGSEKVPNVPNRAADLPKALAKYAQDKKLDVIALQEVWDKPDYSAIKTALEDKNTGYEVVLGTEPQSPFLGSGLMVAVKKANWKVDPEKSANIVFKERKQGENFTKKGFMIVEIVSTADKDLRIIVSNTHHQVPYVDENGIVKKGKEDAVEGHKAQVIQIGKALATASMDGKLPVIALGDFNSGPGLIEDNYKIYEKEFKLKNAFLELHPWEKLKEKERITWDRSNILVKDGDFPTDPDCLIDHCLFKNGAKSSLEAISAEIVLKDEVVAYKNKPNLKTPLSDHYGMLVELELK